MTESLAAVAFYLGLGALVFGGVRLARAQLEGRPRDRAGLAALAVAFVCFAFAIVVFTRGPRGVLPF